MMVPTSPMVVNHEEQIQKVDEICIKCKVRRSAKLGTTSSNDAFEMSCSLRRWESQKAISPTVTVFGDGNDDIPAEIVLTSLNHVANLPQPSLDRLTPDKNRKDRSRPPVTGSTSKPMPLRSRIRSSNSDIASMAFDPTRSEQLENLITHQSTNGRSSSEGAPMAHGLRKRRNLSITSLIPPPPPPTDAVETTTPEPYSSGRSSHAYRIPLSNILKARICPAVELGTIELQTVSTGGNYELIFESHNSFDVVSAFLMSLLPQKKLILDEVEKNKAQGRNPNPRESTHAHNKTLPRTLARTQSGSTSYRKSGSFNMDQFMDKKLREGAANEGTFERLKRKMSKLSVEMNELVMGIQLPELCGGHCTACVGGDMVQEKETRQYEDMKTTRNFDGFVDALDMPSPTRRSSSPHLPTTYILSDENYGVGQTNSNVGGRNGRSPPPATPTITPVGSSDEKEGGPLNLAFSYELSPSRSGESAGSRRNNLALSKSSACSVGSKSRTSAKNKTCASANAPSTSVDNLQKTGSKESLNGSQNSRSSQHISSTIPTQIEQMSSVPVVAPTHAAQTPFKVADL